MNSTKKQRKTIEWEKLEVSSRKLEMPREHFKQKWDYSRRKTHAERVLCHKGLKQHPNCQKFEQNPHQEMYAVK